MSYHGHACRADIKRGKVYEPLFHGVGVGHPALFALFGFFERDVRFALYPYQIVFVKCEFELIRLIHHLPVADVLVRDRRLLREPSFIDINGVYGHAVIFPVLGKDVRPHHGLVACGALSHIGECAPSNGLIHLDFLYPIALLAFSCGLIHPSFKRDLCAFLLVGDCFCCLHKFGEQQLVGAPVGIRVEIILYNLVAVFVLAEFQLRYGYFFHNDSFGFGIFEACQRVLMQGARRFPCGDAADEYGLCLVCFLLPLPEREKTLSHLLGVGQTPCRKFLRKPSVRLCDKNASLFLCLFFFLLRFVGYAQFVDDGWGHARDDGGVYGMMDVAVLSHLAYPPSAAQRRRHHPFDRHGALCAHLALRKSEVLVYEPEHEAAYIPSVVERARFSLVFVDLFPQQICLLFRVVGVHHAHVVEKSVPPICREQPFKGSPAPLFSVLLCLDQHLVVESVVKAPAVREDVIHLDIAAFIQPALVDARARIRTFPALFLVQFVYINPFLRGGVSVFFSYAVADRVVPLFVLALLLFDLFPLLCGIAHVSGKLDIHGKRRAVFSDDGVEHLYGLRHSTSHNGRGDVVRLVGERVPFQQIAPLGLPCRVDVKPLRSARLVIARARPQMRDERLRRFYGYMPEFAPVQRQQSLRFFLRQTLRLLA